MVTSESKLAQGTTSIRTGRCLGLLPFWAVYDLVNSSKLRCNVQDVGFMSKTPSHSTGRQQVYECDKQSSAASKTLRQNANPLCGSADDDRHAQLSSIGQVPVIIGVNNLGCLGGIHEAIGYASAEWPISEPEAWAYCKADLGDHLLGLAGFCPVHKAHWLGRHQQLALLSDLYG